MNWRKALLLSLVGLLVLALVAGCGGDKKTSSKTPPTKYIRYVVGVEPETLDPRKSTGMPEAKIEANLFEGLMTHGKDGTITAGVAEKWNVSQDGKVYTFTIRANAKWSNGDPVTAHDFEYTWKKTLDPNFASKYAQQLYFISGAEEYNCGKGSVSAVGVKAIDDKTLQVTLAQPTPFFLSVLAHHAYYPVNKKVDESNPKWMVDPKTFVGNGPFMMKSWTHNSKIETVKNPNYWDAANVKMEQLDFLLTDNNATALSMYDSGQADYVDALAPADLQRLLKEGTLKTAPYLTNNYYAFNTTKAPFDNVKVRKAFSLAVDREAIVKNLNNGSVAAYGFVPPGVPDAEKGSDFRKTGGNLIKNADVAEAKKLLAEAGYPDGKGLPPITLIYNTNEVHKAVAEAIQEMWKKNLGVSVELQNQEWKVFLQNRKTGNYQIARHGWVGDYEDPLTFMALLESSNGNNDSKYSNPKYDELIKLSYAELDPKKRMNLFHQMEKIAIEEDMAVMPNYFQPQYILAKPYVKDYINTPIGLTYFKYAVVQ